MNPGRTGVLREMLVFVEGGKPYNQEKKQRGKARTNNELNPLLLSTAPTLLPNFDKFTIGCWFASKETG